MSRVKRSVTARARHKKILKQAKGYRHARKNVFRLAKQAVLKAKKNAYKGRKLKKRYFRSLWILKINAACKRRGIKYSRLIKFLSETKQDVDRKILADIAQNKPEEFDKIVKKLVTKSD